MLPSIKKLPIMPVWLVRRSACLSLWQACKSSPSVMASSASTIKLRLVSVTS
ncbi:Uncharacterised protein [Vibrio cholerae]|nr:Uncharacterised protein [Vibrio cholerae]CSI88410.1 Uncharacterised protein [Vibrio cholerae]